MKDIIIDNGLEEENDDLKELFTEEDLRQMIIEEMNREITFESVINSKIEEEKSIEESFYVTGQGYEVAKLINDDAYRYISSLKRVVDYGIKVFKFFYLNEMIENNLVEFQTILSSRKESLAKDKEFLVTIKNCLYILKLYSTPELNYEICNILEKICVKSNSILESISEGMENSEVQYMGYYLQKYNKEIEDMDNYIENKMLKLGLAKKQ